ncbi:MAG: hypothetical protein JW940_12085, partial [Polyangiaceae bacterium]|nr:hypothetical protein [Polyangiaceae bacterium]
MRAGLLRSLMFLLVGAAALLAPIAFGQSPQREDESAPERVAIKGGSGEGQEVESLRTETSRTFRLEDGRYFAQVFSEPINFKDESGAWRVIDNTLRATSDGWFENSAGAYSVRLPARMEDGAVRFSSGQAWAEFRLQGAQGEGRTAGSEQSFQNVLPGVAVSYAATGGGVKETVTLAGSDTPSELRFAVSASDDLRLQTAESGAIEFQNGQGDVVFSFAA